MLNSTQSIRRSTLVPKSLVLSAAAALFLAGCSNADETPIAPAPSPAAPSTAAPSAPVTSASPTSAPSQTTTGISTEALLRAGKAAEAEVDKSKVTSIEVQGNGSAWEVTVTTANGTESDLTVSGDGTSVTRGPQVENDSAADRAENARDLDGAKLDYADAVEKLTDTVADGAVRELNLDADRGTSVWEATVADAAQNVEREITLDAGTGTVLSDEVDD